MKSIQKLSFITSLILFLMPCKGFSQKAETIDTTKNKLISAAREIMVSASTCALITLDEEGRPRVRTMDPFSPENDLTVWFGTNEKSRKVNQIKQDQRVTLYYLDSDESGYVMIYGIAQLVDDQKEKEKRWKNEWEAFYTNNKKEYLLIKVIPEWMEISSPNRGITNDTITWQPQRVLFKSK